MGLEKFFESENKSYQNKHQPDVYMTPSALVKNFPAKGGGAVKDAKAPAKNRETYAAHFP